LDVDEERRRRVRREVGLKLRREAILDQIHSEHREHPKPERDDRALSSRPWTRQGCQPVSQGYTAKVPGHPADETHNDPGAEGQNGRRHDQPDSEQYTANDGTRLQRGRCHHPGDEDSEQNGSQ
jgi:hypothetical protein